MKIDLISKERVSVTPETRRELVDLLDVLGVRTDSDEYFEKMAGFVQGGRPSFEKKAGRDAVEGNGGFARVSGTTTTWMVPYWDEVKKQLGAEPFDVDLVPGLRMGTVKHTHFIETLRQVGADTEFTLTFIVYPRMGQKFLNETWFLEAANREAQRHLAADLGNIVPCPEYIQLDNGLYKKNPKWGRGDTQYTPAIGDPHLLRYIGNRWLERFATPTQKEVVARIHRPDRAGLDWFNKRTYNNVFNLDGCNSQITFQEFQKL